MKVKLFIHIGAAKCGSTAIQYFLHLNETKLAQKGFFIPRFDQEISSNTINCVSYFENLKPISEKSISRFRSDLLNTYMQAIEPGNFHSVIISAENLINASNFHIIFSELENFFDIYIIAYIREQADYLESAWQQWFFKEYKELDSWLVENVGILANWNDLLSPWIQLFGKEHILLRTYSRTNFPYSNIVFDFADTINLKCTDLECGCSVNHSMNAFTSRLLSTLSQHVNIDLNDHCVSNILKDYAPSTTSKDVKCIPIFSADLQRAIRCRYQKSNEILKRNFFPDTGGPLFEINSTNDNSQYVLDDHLYSRLLAELIQSIKANSK